MGFEKPLTGAQRTARHRAALRAQGLRPRTFWLPDTQTTSFREQAQRDVARLWELEGPDAEAMAFVQAMMDEVLRDLPE